ncbi:MAG TPA: hypothetical protein VMU29_02230 [Smithella sp.]|nr:hypothetical protein [Smithella sp.]
MEKMNKTAKRLLTIILFVIALTITGFSAVYAQTPQETLNQYIADLRNKPDDIAVREKIIKYVQTMKPAPMIPEEAMRHMARGKAAFKDAKDVKDFSEAAEEFKEALLAAPWLAEGYYNLGIVQDKAGNYAEAMQNLQFYLMASIDAPDKSKVKELIYEIEFRKDKVAKESSPEAMAEKSRKAEEDFIKKLDGTRYVVYDANQFHNITWTLDIIGNRVAMGSVCTKWTPPSPTCDGVWRKQMDGTLNGRDMTFGNPWKSVCAGTQDSAVTTGRISEDGMSVTIEVCHYPTVYYREK